MSSCIPIPGVDESLGCELERSREGGTTVVSLLVRRHVDLVLPQDVRVRVTIATRFLAPPVSRNTSFRSESSNNSNSSNSITGSEELVSVTGSEGRVTLGRVSLVDPHCAAYFPSAHIRTGIHTGSHTDSRTRTHTETETELFLPWLQELDVRGANTLSLTKSCPLALWFFSVRALVRKTASAHEYAAWRASVLLSPLIAFHDYSRSLSQSVCVRETDRETQTTTTSFLCGVGRHRGRRNYMEDVDFACERVSTATGTGTLTARERERGRETKREVSLFGVLDGHGGAECAQFVADEMPSRIAARLRSQTHTQTHTQTQSRESGKEGERVREMAQMLHSVFLEVDDDFVRMHTASHVYRPSNAGSTANVLLHDRESDRCFVANTGDTRAVLRRESQNIQKYHKHRHTNVYSSTAAASSSSSSSAISYAGNKKSECFAVDLSFDRKATDAEEIVRIAQQGGFVVGGRVLGSLAVSRAFGDALLKTSSKLTALTETNNNGNSNDNNDDMDSTPSTKRYRYVIPDPEITFFTPCRSDRFVIIATDGLWDVMSSAAADAFVTQQMIKEQLLLPQGHRSSSPFSADPSNLDYNAVRTEHNPALSQEEVKEKLNKIATAVATHAVETLRSGDNVTVMILLVLSNNEEATDDDLDLPVSSSLPARSSDIVESVFTRPSTMQSQFVHTEMTVKKSTANVITHSSMLNSRDNFLQELELLTSAPSQPRQPAALSSRQTAVPAKAKKNVDLDDDEDFMNFLKDDSNF